MLEIHNSISCTESNIREEDDRGFEIIDCLKQEKELDNEIAGFTQERLLEVISLVKISYYVSDYDHYNNKFNELKSRGYKIPSQLKEEGYKIAQFHNVDSKGKAYRHAGYFAGKGKEVCIVYRGSRNYFDYIQDVRMNLISVMPNGGKVHSGFYSLFRDSWESVYRILKGYANEQGLEIKDLEILFAGHSMGGAIANIAALCLRMTEDAENLHVATFASPRVFDFYGAQFYNEHLGKNTIRVVNLSDSVPSLPLGVLGYKHVGEQVKLGHPGLGLDHQVDIYRNLILNMEKKDFKSDNSVSGYYYLSYAFLGLYNFATSPMNLVSYSYEDDEIQYFRQIQDKNKNASFSQPMKDLDNQVCEDIEPDIDGVIISIVRPCSEYNIINTPINGSSVALNQCKRVLLFDLFEKFCASHVVENQLCNQLYLSLLNVDKRKFEISNTAIDNNLLVSNNLTMNKKSHIEGVIVVKKDAYTSPVVRFGDQVNIYRNLIVKLGKDRFRLDNSISDYHYISSVLCNLATAPIENNKDDIIKMLVVSPTRRLSISGIERKQLCDQSLRIDQAKVETSNTAIDNNLLISNNLIMNKKSNVEQGIITKKGNYISKNVVVAALITSTLVSAIFALYYFQMLTIGIVLGACCLSSAAIVNYYKSPFKVSDNLSVEPLNIVAMNVS